MAASPIVVAYQGEHGAYSEQAACSFPWRTHLALASASYTSHNEPSSSSVQIDPLPRPTFASVFKALECGDAAYAMVPIENSLGGSIHDNYDLLVTYHTSISIVAEMQFQVHHCLMALPHDSLSSVHTVMSHPQALAQCENFLTNMGVRVEKQYDTAGAAKMIAEQNMTGHAAVASALAAEVYGLRVLATNIEDNVNTNYTRFLLLARTQRLSSYNNVPGDPALLEWCESNEIGMEDCDSYKTSIVCSLADTPGALFKALSVFALRDIQLTKIESRPGKRMQTLLDSSAFDHLRSPSHHIGSTSGTSSAFKYLFYLDFLAHVPETRVQNALKHLGEIAPFLRVLGTYKVASVDSGSLRLTNTRSISAYSKLKIGIVGFGNFGQFLAKSFLKYGHIVHATSKSNYSSLCAGMNIIFHPNAETFCAEDLDVLVFSVSILSFAHTISTFPFDAVTKPCLVVDVLSVKIHPKTILLHSLSPKFDILCTHPMFGPDSGKHSWKALPMMFERVRISRQSVCDNFLSLFEIEGCRMLEMECELHDAYAAGSQFITHTTGRILANLGCHDTPINTKGYSMLLQVIANTSRDSFDLYKGLYHCNPHSQAQMEAMSRSFEALRTSLMQNEALQQPSVISNKSVNTDFDRFNPRVLAMNESKTAQITDLAKSLQSRGERIISLSVGEPLDVQTPQPIINAAIAALQAGETRYTPVAGLLTLRQAISDKLERENSLSYDADCIVVSNGAKQSILQSVMALAIPGSEIVIPAPYWVSYPDMCTLCGAKPIIVHCTPESGFTLDPVHLRSVLTERTQALILCSPSNPTGGVYSSTSLLAIAEVLRDFPRCWIISDEIYEHLLFDNAQHISFASLPGMFERTITVNGFSKCFAMTGFRLGYIAAPRAVAALCNKIQGQLTSCASSISQLAGIAALKMDLGPFKQSLNEKLCKKRDMVHAILSAVPGVKLSSPLGAFYAMPDCSAYFGRQSPDSSGKIICDSDSLCMHLLQQYHVALVPGSAFGAPNTVRISYASDSSDVQQGVQALADCLRQLIQLPATA